MLTLCFADFSISCVPLSLSIHIFSVFLFLSSLPVHHLAGSGMSWLQALRAFASSLRQHSSASASASSSPSSSSAFNTAATRLALYDRVARDHLHGAPGSQLHPDSLGVLRHTRWELMKHGTPHAKSALLAHVLKSYAEAADACYYEETHPARPRRQSTSGSSASSSSSFGASAAAAAAGGPSTTAPSTVRQSLLVEQLQCLVEAKVNGIPLNVSHYRYPLRSPQLAEVSPDLPLLLMEELTHSTARHGPNQHSTSTSSSSSRGRGSVNSEGASSGTVMSSSPRNALQADLTPDEEADAWCDCCTGLASAGHVVLAASLIPPQHFARVIRAVAQRSRDGAERAWQLVDAVPLGRYLSDDPAERGWVQGIAEAAMWRHRHGKRDDLAVKQWLERFFAVWEGANADRAKQRATAGGGHRKRQMPRCLLEAYIMACPPAAWQDALDRVLAYNETAQAASPSTQSEAKDDKEELFEESLPAPSTLPATVADNSGDGDDGGGRLAMGRIMNLLHLAQQSRVLLRLFLGSDDVLAALMKMEEEEEEEEESAKSGADVLTAGDGGGRRAGRVRQLVQGSTTLSAQDRSHPAVFNHAMVAFAEVGLWRYALAVYADPAIPHNAFTHLSAARIILRPRVTDDTVSTKAALPLNNATYAVCAAAFDHIAASPATSRAAARDGLFESLALWATMRDDWALAARCAAAADPQLSRYTRVIALVAAIRGGDEASANEIRTQLTAICQTPFASLRQIALSVALVSQSERAMHVCGAVESGTLEPALAAIVVHSLCSLIGSSQQSFDDFIRVLAEYHSGVHYHQTRAPPDAKSAMTSLSPHCLAGDRLLPGLLQQMGGTAVNETSWQVILEVVQAVGQAQGLSMALAAPAMVSAGMPADYALHFLPSV